MLGWITCGWNSTFYNSSFLSSTENERRIPNPQGPFTRTVNVTVFCERHVTYKHHHRTPLNPILNDTKNDDIDGMCKRSLVYLPAPV